MADQHRTGPHVKFLHAKGILWGGLGLLTLYLISLYRFLLFHSLAEIFSIVIACGIFMVAWNARRFLENDYLLFLGVAYGFVAGLDLIHTLAYKGMGVFPDHGANLPTQLWIAARYVESISLLAAPLFLKKRVRMDLLVFVYGTVTILLLSSIFFWPVFPACFVDGQGLTPFKVISEYIICLILLGALGGLLHHRAWFDRLVLRYLMGAIFFTMIEEIAFTFYISVYGLSNLMGHFFKILSFYLIYKAIIETGFEKPYALLFREIKKSESALRSARDHFKSRASERGAELIKACKVLKNQIIERKKAEEAVRASERKYSALVESSLTGIFMSQDHRILFANRRFAEMHGYRRKELLGMSPDHLVHPEDRDLIRQYRQRRFRGEAVPSVYEIRGLKKGGRIIWVQRRIAVIPYSGKPAILGNVVEVTERKKMEEDLRRSEKALRRLSSELLTAQEEESKRIALELHDGIGQILSAIKISVEGAIEELGRRAPSQGAHALKPIIPMVQEAVEEVRRISRNLRPSIIDDLGILATISWFCRDAATIYTGLRIRKQLSIEEYRVPEPLKIVIFRILQEAINNVAKHSEADRVRVTLKEEHGDICLTIEDNGKGFEVDGGVSHDPSVRGLGLASMKERTEHAGGTFSIDSQAGKGTTIRALWPIAHGRILEGAVEEPDMYE